MKGKKLNDPFFIPVNIKKYFLLGLLLLGGLLAKSQEKSLFVIANKIGAPREMKLSELKSVFHGERISWEKGEKIVIAMVKSKSGIGAEIADKIYNKTPEEVRGFWAGIVFSGKFDAFYVFNEVNEVESFIAATPGSIAITDSAVNTASIKTIIIDGKKSF